MELVRNDLVKWVAQNPGYVPSWFTKRCEHLHKMKSPDGFSTLSYLFLNHHKDAQDPHPGKGLRDVRILSCPTRQEIQELKEPIATMAFDLWSWVHRDRHHAQHEAGNRGRAERNRLDTYRCFAKWVMDRYSECRVQDIGLQGVLSKGSELENVQRRQAKSAAIGELVACLRGAASNQGGKVGYVKAPEEARWAPSDIHYLCGERTGVKDLHHTVCSKCDTRVDRDLNAALNTLRAPLEWVA
jgi:hypothetical protein